jgi:uncharacterized membrane protein YkvA (DUF1232 family)
MSGSGDPFPREPFVALLKRLPAYGRLAWAVAREPALSRGRRLALYAGGAYLVSPIDLVPGIIPVAGQLDDAAAVLLALRAALAGLPPDVRDRHYAAAGLSAAVLDGDLRTIGRTAAWMARRAGRLAWRGAKATARASVRATGRLLHAIRGSPDPGS